MNGKILAGILGIMGLVAIVTLIGGSARADVHTLLVTNSTAQNQAELDRTIDGDSVWMETGIYHNDNFFYLYKNLVINGTGISNTFITTVSNKGMWRIQTGINVSISNMTLDSTYGVYGIRGTANGYINITDCDFIGYGIESENNVITRRCNFSVGIGIKITSGNGNICVNNTNISAGVYGINNQGSGIIVVEGSNITAGDVGTKTTSGDIFINASNITSTSIYGQPAAFTEFSYYIYLVDCYNISIQEIRYYAVNPNLIHHLFITNTTEENQNELGNTSDGDLVYLDPGTYTLTAPLTIGTDVFINGTGNTSTIIAVGGIIINSSSNVGIHNLRIDNSFSGETALTINTGGNLNLSLCDIISSESSYAIYATAFTGNITSCKIIANTGSTGYGIYSGMLTGSVSGSISKSYITGKGGISTGTFNSNISDSIIVATNNGIFIDAFTGNISESIIVATNNGIFANTAFNGTITNSTIHGDSRAIDIAAGTVYLVGCYNQTPQQIALGTLLPDLTYIHGLNIFCLPNTNSGYNYASDITNLTGVFYLSKFNHSSQTWTTRFGSTGENFPLTVGEGYILYMSILGNISFENNTGNLTANYSVNYTGLSLVSNPTGAAVNITTFMGESTIFYGAIWNNDFTAFSVYFVSSAGPDLYDIPAFGCVWIYATAQPINITYVGV